MAHVQLTHWETSDVRKGKNLEYQREVIVYEVPLPKIFKTRIIDVLNQFHKDFGCKLTVRGRGEDSNKRVKMEQRKGEEVEKIHRIMLKLLEAPQQAAEDRLRRLCNAEQFVDAFLRSMIRSPEDVAYMFPPEDAAQQDTGNVATQVPERRLDIGSMNF